MSLGAKDFLGLYLLQEFLKVSQISWVAIGTKEHDRYPAYKLGLVFSHPEIWRVIASYI